MSALPNPFLNSTATQPPAVGDPAVALSRTSVQDAQTDAAAELIQNSDGRRQSLADGTPEIEAGLTCGSTLGLPDSSESAVASSDLQPRATAEPISVSPGGRRCSLPSGESDPSVMLDYAPGENLPSSNEGRSEEAPASAPSKNPDAGVLGTEHIHEIFHWVRKLMKPPQRFVLDADAFLADVEEVPLFIREDGYLKRQA